MPPIPLHPPHPTLPPPTTPAAIQAAIDSIALKNDMIKLQRKGEKDHGIPEEVEGRTCLWCEAVLGEEARVLGPGNTKITVVCQDCRCRRIAAKKWATTPQTQCGRIRHIVPGTGEMHRYCYDCWLTNLRSSQKWYLKRKLEDDAIIAQPDSPLPTRLGRSRANKEKQRLEEMRAHGEEVPSGSMESMSGDESDEEEEGPEDGLERIIRSEGLGDGLASGENGSIAPGPSSRRAPPRVIRVMSKEEKQKTRATRDQRRMVAEDEIRRRMEEQLGEPLPRLEGYERVDQLDGGAAFAPVNTSDGAMHTAKANRDASGDTVNGQRQGGIGTGHARTGTGRAMYPSVQPSPEYTDDELDELEQPEARRPAGVFDLESLPDLSPDDVDVDITEAKLETPTEPETQLADDGVGVSPSQTTPGRKNFPRSAKSAVPSNGIPSPSTPGFRTSSRKAALLAKVAMAAPEKIIPSATASTPATRADKLARRPTGGEKDKKDPTDKREGAKPMTEMEKMEAGAVAAGAQIRIAMGLQPRAPTSPGVANDKSPRIKLTRPQTGAPTTLQHPSAGLPRKERLAEAKQAEVIHPPSASMSGRGAGGTSASAAQLSKEKWERANPGVRSGQFMAPFGKAAMAMAVTRAANAVLNETAEPSASASSALGVTAKTGRHSYPDEEERRQRPVSPFADGHVVDNGRSVNYQEESAEAEKRKTAKRVKTSHPAPYPSAHPAPHPSAHPAYHASQYPPHQAPQVHPPYPARSSAYPDYPYSVPSYPTASPFYGQGAAPYPYDPSRPPYSHGYPPGGYAGFTGNAYTGSTSKPSGAPVASGYAPGYGQPSPTYPPYPAYLDYYGYYEPPRSHPSRSSDPRGYPAGWPAEYTDPRMAYGAPYGYSPPQGMRSAAPIRSSGYPSSYGASSQSRSHIAHTAHVPKTTSAPTSSRRVSAAQAPRPAVSKAPAPSFQRQSGPDRRQRSRNPDSESDTESEEERDRSRRQARASQTAHSASIAHAQALGAVRNGASASGYPSSPPLTGSNGKGKQAEYAYPRSPSANATGDEDSDGRGWQDMPFNTGGDAMAVDGAV